MEAIETSTQDPLGAGGQTWRGWQCLRTNEMSLNDSTEGRWASPDPMGGDISNPQSLNRYAYVLNSPVNLTDPSGLCSEPDSSYIDSNGVVQVVGSEPCWWQIFGLGFCTVTGGFGCGDNGPNANVHPSGGGGSGSPSPKPTPSDLQVSTMKLIKSFNQCAANVADKYSVASLLHANNVPLLGAALSSSTAAASHLLFGTRPSEYVPAGANLAAGAKAGAILTGTATTAGKIPVDQGFQSIFTTIAPTRLGETAAGNSVISGAEKAASFLDYLVLPLVTWDKATYGYGEAACTAQTFGGG